MISIGIANLQWTATHFVICCQTHSIRIYYASMHAYIQYVHMLYIYIYMYIYMYMVYPSGLRPDRRGQQADLRVDFCKHAALQLLLLHASNAWQDSTGRFCVCSN